MFLSEQIRSCLSSSGSGPSNAAVPRRPERVKRFCFSLARRDIACELVPFKVWGAEAVVKLASRAEHRVFGVKSNISSALYAVSLFCFWFPAVDLFLFTGWFYCEGNLHRVVFPFVLPGKTGSVCSRSLFILVFSSSSSGPSWDCLLSGWIFHGLRLSSACPQFHAAAQQPHE